jgi:hypothetical protein
MVKIAALTACVLAVGAGVLAWRAATAKSPLETFWAPALESPHPVLLCVGELRSTKLPLGGIVWGDSIALAESATLLRTYKKPYSIRGEATTKYGDLQKGPVVLIGAFNNDWTLRFTQSMRFRFDGRVDTFEQWIADRKNPDARFGLVKGDTEVMTNQKADLALVARVFDAETKQPVIIMAGVTPSGTWAAGEFATNPQYLNEFLETLPVNWQTKNLEILLSVDVVDDEPGPPHVVASSIW